MLWELSMARCVVGLAGKKEKRKVKRKEKGLSLRGANKTLGTMHSYNIHQGASSCPGDERARPQSCSHHVLMRTNNIEVTRKTSINDARRTVGCWARRDKEPQCSCGMRIHKF